MCLILRPVLPRWLSGKESACQCSRHGLISEWEDPLQKEMTTSSSILAWKIPQTEEPGGLQSMESVASTEQLSMHAIQRHMCAAYAVALCVLCHLRVYHHFPYKAQGSSWEYSSDVGLCLDPLFTIWIKFIIFNFLLLFFLLLNSMRQKSRKQPHVYQNFEHQALTFGKVGQT